jgi:8-oxo-dGTP pyrophosphatase MutT (NUDIX family)
VRDLTELERRLRERLAHPLPGAPAQLRFAPQPARKGWRPDDLPASARQAAALILLYPGEHGPAFPLTVRRDDLPHHPGQVSLPGGGLDPDEDPLAGALRETHEEIGIHPDEVRIIGALSPLWVIVSNFLVRPFVGIVDHRPDFRAEPREVAALLEAPVSAVHDESLIRWDQRVRDGVLIRYPYFTIAGHRVWGATAMMLSEFGEVVSGTTGTTGTTGTRE